MWRDQLNRDVLVSDTSRIVSLVPSITEYLYYLGLENHLVGITRFCVHPPHLRNEKKIIGGTKNVDVEAIRILLPGLTIAAKEENIKEQVEAIAEFCPVWVADVDNLASACDMMSRLGEITRTQVKAEEIIQSIGHSLKVPNTELTQPLRALYLIWRKPWMAAGTDTFISDMLSYAGFANALTGFISPQGKAEYTRYPTLSNSEMEAARPDVILLSSEPYAFKEKHLDEIREIYPTAKAVLCNGEYFSWYGSRLNGASAYFEKLREHIGLTIV